MKHDQYSIHLQINNYYTHDIKLDQIHYSSVNHITLKSQFSLNLYGFNKWRTVYIHVHVCMYVCMYDTFINDISLFFVLLFGYSTGKFVRWNSAIRIPRASHWKICNKKVKICFVICLNYPLSNYFHSQDFLIQSITSPPPFWSVLKCTIH